MEMFVLWFQLGHVILIIVCLGLIWKNHQLNQELKQLDKEQHERS